ncbi:hypothetical protein [Microbacterium testaceum]|uniref:hypothetical protein n=1 Tax=Microbacterium testaceum TaxID=2033 RepID=UPI001D17BE5E|nr:hypothetical protein [Microbacterium testaceum]MCC4248614.1 hypothetical protein [Microbacterium testaceum]
MTERPLDHVGLGSGLDAPSRRELLAGGLVAATGSVLLDRAIRSGSVEPAPGPLPTDGTAGGSVYISSRHHSGIDPTGRKDSGPGLTEALGAVPEGWEAVIAPGRYLVSNSITPTSDLVRLSGYGVTLVQSGASPIISVKAEWATPFRAISFGTSTPGDGAEPTSKITVDGNPGWGPGTLIKVISDDVIPGSRTSADGRASRNGEFAIVASTNRDEIVTTARLRESYSDNARVVEVSRNTAQIRGFTLEARSASAKVVGASMIYLAGLLAPVVEDLRCISAHGPVVHMNSCYGFHVSRLDVAFAEDDAPHRLGYGVLDNCSEFGTVRDSIVRHARHAYTDDTPAISRNTSNPHIYGRSYGNQILGCHAVSPSRSGFDTHHSSECIVFSSCSVDSGAEDVSAFALRGRNHLVVGCSAQRIGLGVRAFTEAERGGESFGHVVQAFTARSVTDTAIAADVHPTGHPRSGELETRPVLTVAGAVIDGTSSGIRARNAAVSVTDASILMNGTRQGQTFLQNEGSDVQLSRVSLLADHEQSWSPISASTAPDGRNARLSLRDVSVSMSASAVERADAFFDGTGHIVDLVGVTFSSLPSGGLGAIAEGSRVQWQTQPEDPSDPVLSSAAFRLTSSLDMTQVWNSTDPHVIVQIESGSGGATELTLGRPRRDGQILTLICAPENAAIRVRDTSSAPFAPRASSDRVLEPGQAMTLTWSGSSWLRTS